MVEEGTKHVIGKTSVDVDFDNKLSGKANLMASLFARHILLSIGIA